MNNKSNSNKQTRQKKKMLLEMKKEINKLENEIKYRKLTNIEIYALRSMKIMLRTGQLIAPFAVTAGITFGAFSAYGGIPFYRDSSKHELEMMKEIDSLGNVRYEQQYEEYENSNNVITYYSKWSFADNNFYSRDIETYAIGDITEETMLKLINEDVKSLREVLGEPILKQKETRNNLLEEELQYNAFLQARIYSKFKENFIIIKETSDDNIKETLLWVLATIFAEIIPFSYRTLISKFKYKQCIKKIKEKYPTVDVEELTKKLEIKRSNYNRLTR